MTFDMAHPRSLSTNGAQNGVESPAQPSGHQPRFSRPFTLQEALPFSPFTSVIPFESGTWLAEDSFNQKFGFLINLQISYRLRTLVLAHLRPASPISSLDMISII